MLHPILKLIPISLMTLAFSFPVLACEVLKGKVVGVRDGDTIEVLIRKKEVPVRLAGIDAPESSQAFGRKAKKFTSEKVFGKKVRIVSCEKDKYKRKVGEVFFDGISLNETLVAAGLAWKEPRYSKSLGLEALEAEARAQKKGLWAQPAPVPPWEFRNHSATR